MKGFEPATVSVLIGNYRRAIVGGILEFMCQPIASYKGEPDYDAATHKVSMNYMLKMFKMLTFQLLQPPPHGGWEKTKIIFRFFQYEAKIGCK